MRIKIIDGKNEGIHNFIVSRNKDAVHEGPILNYLFFATTLWSMFYVGTAVLCTYHSGIPRIIKE